VLLAWALMAWVPICGAFLPLSFPMADRYLYFILPGLLGAALCWVAPLGRALAAHGPVPSAWLARAGAVGALGLGLAFASQSYARARVWRSPATQMADAIRHYPDGIAATLMGARRAAQSGDADTAVALLRRARDRGYMRLSQLVGDPAFARMAQEPAFRALLADMAQGLIDTWDRPGASQPELHQVAYAHLVRGEKALAAAALERALEVGGPRDEEIRHDLARLRRELDRAAGDR
jgi:hypothetical protein